MGILFSEDYENVSPEDLADILLERIRSATISKMVVTMGDKGAVYADENGDKGVYPALKVDVIDTTVAGDAFLCMHRALHTEKPYGKPARSAPDFLQL